MKFLKNRVFPFVCVLSILISICVVPASAVMVMPDGFRDSGSVDDWNAAIRDPGSTVLSNLSGGFDELGVEVELNYQDMFWSLVDPVIMSCFGEVGIDDLQSCVARYNTMFDRPLGETFFSQLVSGTKEVFSDSLGLLFLKNLDVQFDIVEHPVSGLLRIYEVNTGLFVVSSSGAYPYVDPSAGVDTSGGNHWIAKSTAEANLTKSEVLTGSQLQQVCTMLEITGEPVYIANFGSKYKAIYRDGREVYANADGYPFVASANDSLWAVNQDRTDSIVKDDTGAEVDDLPEDNVTNIDLSGMTVTLPDGSVNLIDQIIYDESTKTYHIDSHDTYNSEINYYYQWNYYINYTSVTYIGTTEEYNKYYEVYYELPDGRDSADLTAEELEQLNVSIDVIPYGRSADDTSLRSLYHFDGDTHDSSYWNYCTDFTWNTGASLTYMDAGVFEGALYLDETEHDFTLTLPSNLTSGDFTLQFRYYQSYTAAPQTDSYISVDGDKLLQFNGGYFLDSSGRKLAATPIGSWNEIALIRNDGVLYYYLNGVCIGSVDNLTAYRKEIVFHFGSSQQTYKYFDELRVLNYALQAGGAYYDPTSVPHDTNLTLVLPDSYVPVADEYWEITGSENALSSLDFSGSVLPSNLRVHDDCTESAVVWNEGDEYRFPSWWYFSDCTTVGIYDDYASVTAVSSVPDYYDGVFTSGLVTGLGTLGSKIASSSSNTYYGGFKPGDYTISIVFADGSVVYVPVTYDLSKLGTYPMFSAEYDWGKVMIRSESSKNWHPSLAIMPAETGASLDIVYVEVCPGESTLTAEKITSVTAFDSDSMNTPTLAVRTDLDITSYQIGGARPSLPTKGQVWALVESGYITSIQIYNGSAWESCDGRIWTGSRWIPASSYNVITLQDMYDIVDATQNYEYIYSESGFWSWWQKSWNAFTEKLFRLLGDGSSSGCQHAYSITSSTAATCTDPGKTVYTCALCGDQYTTTTDALGHDWLASEVTETTYSVPEGTSCPDCSGTTFTHTRSDTAFTCTCSDCGAEWTVEADVTYGSTTFTCSRCGETYVESEDPDSGLFAALANFLSDGITWVTGKFTELAESINSIHTTFRSYLQKIQNVGGDFPALLGAAIGVLPEDFMAVVWFSIVALVILAVWLKFFK